MDGVSTQHGRVITSGFTPHPLARGPHAQTLLPFLLRRAPRVQFRSERIATPDGDEIELCWFGADQGSIVILLHGLTGGVDSKYLLGTAQQLMRRGLRGLMITGRGTTFANRQHKFYCHGHTADLRHVARWLRTREPQTPLLAAGWSLGGNVLLSYLGEEGADTPLAAAVAVSVPFSVRECAERIRIGSSRIYQKRLLEGLKEQLRRKHAQGSAPVDMGAVLRARDFFEFDDAATAPLNGYRDALDYYARGSSRPLLGRIRIPTLILQAQDDPFLSRAVIPAAQELAPLVTLELSARGGHVGFVGRGPRGLPHYWMEQRISDFLVTRLSAKTL